MGSYLFSNYLRYSYFRIFVTQLICAYIICNKFTGEKDLGSLLKNLAQLTNMAINIYNNNIILLT